MPKDEIKLKTDERFYIDCEFDGHGGPLLSIAMVRENGSSLHVRTTEDATDPWVRENVVPLLDKHGAQLHAVVALDEVGKWIRAFMSDVARPVVIADSPVDIGRFCAAISTGDDGGWQSTGYPKMTFEVHNVDCYPTDLPGAIQHNAYWDAMALREKLASRPPLTNEGELVEVVARAIATEDTLGVQWDALTITEREGYQRLARAALEAASLVTKGGE